MEAPEQNNTDQETPRSKVAPGWLRTAGGWGYNTTFALLALGMLSWILLQLRLAVLPILVALLLSTLVVPLARQLCRARLPRSVASALSLLAFLLFVCGAGTLIAFAASGEMGELQKSLQKGYQSLVQMSAGVAQVPEQELKSWADENLSKLESAGTFKSAMRQIQGIVEGGTILLLSIVFTFLFAWNGDEQFDGLVRMLPRKHQSSARDLGKRIWSTLGKYMRGMFLVALCDAILLGLGYWVIGMPLVGALMLLMFLGAFVPFLGPLIAGGTAVLVGLAEDGATLAALAAGIALLVQQIEGNLLYPLIMGRAVKLHPSVVLFAVTTGGVVGGVIGIFLAVPIAAAVSVAYFYLEERSGSGSGPSGANATPSREADESREAHPVGTPDSQSVPGSVH